MLKNNLSPQTSVSSSEQGAKAVLQITYNVTDEQVHNDYTPAVSHLAAHFVLLCSEWRSMCVLCIGATNRIQSLVKVFLFTFI